MLTHGERQVVRNLTARDIPRESILMMLVMERLVADSASVPEIYLTVREELNAFIQEEKAHAAA